MVEMAPPTTELDLSEVRRVAPAKRRFFSIIVKKKSSDAARKWTIRAIVLSSPRRLVAKRETSYAKGNKNAG